METMNLIIFYVLAIFIVVMSIMAVSAKRVLRAATYLLFVLIATAGIYLLLNYHFLAAVQVAVYAGGIVILFIFAILLTNEHEKSVETHSKKRMMMSGLVAGAGACLTAFILFSHQFKDYSNNLTVVGDYEMNMKTIGFAMMGTEKYQYLLPFELLGVLLLACIIGGVLIARKR